MRANGKREKSNVAPIPALPGTERRRLGADGDRCPEHLAPRHVGKRRDAFADGRCAGSGRQSNPDPDPNESPVTDPQDIHRARG